VPAAPPPQLIVAAAAFGGAAHLLNAVPDLADDDATGVRGLPQRLGAQRSRRAAAALAGLAVFAIL
jgi:4-hydroxybenzoate polyprenyltransferase